jgi:transposase-like protein
MTVEEFEREERRHRRERARELADEGLSAWQIAERLGMTVEAARKTIQRRRRWR